MIPVNTTTQKKSRIFNPKRMKQLIDFKGLEVDGHIYPTDIDGFLEYKDSEYLIFEVKHGDADLPKGQRIALQRMADDFSKVGKRVAVLILEHNVENLNEPIVAADCQVREIYEGKGSHWNKVNSPLTAREAVDIFMKGTTNAQ